MSSAVSELTTCLNCGADLHGPYCARCGQHASALDPTVGHFVHDLSHELLHVDGKMFRSLWLLLARPGFLTLEVLRGRKASYVAPIRLYLVFSVAAFAVISMMPRPAITVEEASRAEEQAEQPQAEGEARSEAQRAAGKSGWSDNSAGGPNFSIDGMTQEQRREFGAEIMHLLPRAMFVLVPVFALMVSVMARKARRHYPSHLYFSLHIHAAYFALLALTTPVELVSQSAGRIAALGRLVYILPYFAIAYRRVYGYSRINATVKTIVLFFSYMFIVLMAFVFTAIAAYFLQHK